MIDAYIVLQKDNPDFQSTLFEKTLRSLQTNLGCFFNHTEISKYSSPETLPEELNRNIMTGTEPYILILDAGVQVQRDFAHRTLRFADTIKEPVGVIGFKVLSFEDLVIDAGIVNPLNPMPFWVGFNTRSRNPLLAGARTDLFIDGKCLLTRRDVWTQIGGFSPEAMLLWAPHYTLMVTRNNYRSLYINEEVAYFNYFESDPNKLEELYKKSKEWFADKYPLLS